MAKLSEILPIVLMGVGVAFLTNAAIILNDDIRGFSDVAAVIEVFVQVVLLLVSLPFIRKVYKNGSHNTWFGRLTVIAASLNTVLIVIITLSLPDIQPLGLVIFLIIALLEVVPIYLIRKYSQVGVPSGDDRYLD